MPMVTCLPIFRQRTEVVCKFCQLPLIPGRYVHGVAMPLVPIDGDTMLELALMDSALTVVKRDAPLTVTFPVTVAFPVTVSTLVRIEEVAFRVFTVNEPDTEAFDATDSEFVVIVPLLLVTSEPVTVSGPVVALPVTVSVVVVTPPLLVNEPVKTAFPLAVKVVVVTPPLLLREPETTASPLTLNDPVVAFPSTSSVFEFTTLPLK
jgi:hypothetical protein